MRAIPIVVLLTISVSLGLLLGYQYLRRVRSKPVLIGMHFLFGAASLEILAMLLRGAPDGTTVTPGTFGKVAAAFVVAALFTGVVGPMLGRQSRTTMNVALGTHATVAATAFVLILIWVARGLG
jgi:hypothetical protein